MRHHYNYYSNFQKEKSKTCSINDYFQCVITSQCITNNTYCSGPVIKFAEGRLMVMVIAVASGVGSSVGSTMIGGMAELVLISTSPMTGLLRPDAPTACTDME